MGMETEVNAMNLERITRTIKFTMRRSAKDAVQLGYMLRRVMDEKLWESTYSDFDSYLNNELSMDYSMATRFININKKFSESGRGMEIASEYEEYTQGALIEMLSMSPEQLQQVNPDMTVRQIRGIKQQDKAVKAEKENEQPVSEQIPGQMKLEEQMWEAPRTYEINDELEPKDAELINYLVKFAIEANQVTYEDLADGKNVFDRILTETSHNGKEYSLFAEKTEEAEYSGISEKPGYAEIAYRDDMQHPFIFLHNDYLVRLVIRELREKRNMCCFSTAGCTYVEGSKLHKIDIGNCPSNCCMSCEQVGACGYACNHAKEEHPCQSEQSETVATSQLDLGQVNTSVEDDLEEATCEEEVEIFTEVQEPEQPETLTVPVDMEEECEEDIIEGTFREITPQEQVDAVQVNDLLSAYGFTKTEYPANSLIDTPGCGHKHDCYSCGQDCKIRQEDRYCVTAPLGNPYSCETMHNIGKLKAEIGENCQFVDNRRAYHTAGSNEAVPCCKNCLNPCKYMCERAAAAVKDLDEEENTEVSAEDVLKMMQVRLDNMLATPKRFSPRQIEQQKIIVGALAAMVCELDLEDTRAELAEIVQPELPVLKNNDSRKAWLEDYKAWGLWYRDENIDINYYKYDFSDGSRLVVAEYPKREAYWNDKLEDQIRYHFLEKNKKKYGSNKRTYDEKYRETPNSITELVEWLKNFQKKVSE